MISRRHKHTRRNALDITPMVDCIFQLLIFFMLATTLRTATTGLGIELPKAVTAQAQEASELVIEMSKDGKMYVSDRQVSHEQLRNMVQERVRKNPNLFVVIKADRRVLYDEVVKAMDDVRAVGGYRLGLAVQPEK